MGEKFVSESIMPSPIGAWFSSAILLPIGIFITYKATRDAVLVRKEQMDSLAKPFIKLYKKLFG
jgi:lipopolysaccharide export system permease protein